MAYWVPLPLPGSNQTKIEMMTRRFGNRGYSSGRHQAAQKTVVLRSLILQVTVCSVRG